VNDVDPRGDAATGGVGFVPNGSVRAGFPQTRRDQTHAPPPDVVDRQLDRRRARHGVVDPQAGALPPDGEAQAVVRLLAIPDGAHTARKLVSADVDDRSQVVVTVSEPWPALEIFQEAGGQGRIAAGVDGGRTGKQVQIARRQVGEQRIAVDVAGSPVPARPALDEVVIGRQHGTVKLDLGQFATGARQLVFEPSRVAVTPEDRVVDPDHRCSGPDSAGEGVEGSAAVARDRAVDEIGLGLGQLPKVNRIFAPLIAIVYPIPKIVFLPVIYVLMGITDISKIFLIALIIFFQILVVVRDEAANLHPELILSVRSLGAGRRALFRYVYFPASLPAMLTALRVSVGTAIAVLFIAEQSLTTYGLGYYIVVETYQVLRYPEMYAGILAMSLLGLALYFVIYNLELRVNRFMSQ